jgi:hypothetical protein
MYSNPAQGNVAMNRTRIVSCLSVLLLATISWAEETDPAEVLKKAKAAYDGLDTYASEGVIVADIEAAMGKTSLETTFSIKLEKPNKYLVTWDQKTGVPGFTQAGAVWSDGTQPYMYMSATKAYSKVNSDEMALGGATGVSGGAANTIPSLFLSAHATHPSHLLSQLVDPKMQAPERIADDDCYVITGSSPASKEETLWISKTSFMIRKYRRSLEPPEGRVKVPELTDGQLEQSIKSMGQEVTAERKEAMRRMMKNAQEMTKNIKGTSTEVHKKIATPKLEAEDFLYKVPEGAILKDSLFGSIMDGKSIPDFGSKAPEK